MIPHGFKKAADGVDKVITFGFKKAADGVDKVITFGFKKASDEKLKESGNGVTF